MITELLILLLFTTGILTAVLLELLILIADKGSKKIGGYIHARRMVKNTRSGYNNSDNSDSGTSCSILHDEGYNKKLEEYINCIYHDPYECEEPEACDNCPLKGNKYV